MWSGGQYDTLIVFQHDVSGLGGILGIFDGLDGLEERDIGERVGR